MFRRQVGGFTLLELMVTVTIAAILLAVALPSFQGSIRSNRVATTTNEALASFALARSEAIRNTRGAGVCASADGATCAADWNSGWLVWSDANGNSAVDAGEAIVRYSQGKDSVNMVATAATVTFDSRGRARGGAQTVNIVPVGVATPARCINISTTGQTRVAQAACP